MLDFASTSVLVVDAQRGFTELCPAELPVPGGAAIVPAVNALLALPFARVDATQDWHPADHRSFAANHPGRNPGDVIPWAGLEQILWPVHCVQDTPGADFHPAFDRGRIFHTTLGHGGDAVRSVDFIVTLQRGAEWAATGKVTQKVPADFPTAEKVSVRP